MASNEVGKYRHLPGFPTGLVPSYTGETIRVHIVEDDEMFTVHQDLLKRSSQFFAGALSGLWKENAERVVRLEDSSAATFRTYIHWLYGGKVVVWTDNDDSGWVVPFILPLYSLGTYLMDDTFLNAIISCLVHIIGSHQSKANQSKIIENMVTHSFIKAVYTNTGAKDPLRKLVADLAVRQGMDLRYELGSHTEYCEFGFDIAYRMLPLGFRRDQIVFDKNIPAVCKYHHHPPGETCVDKPANAPAGASGQPSAENGQIGSLHGTKRPLSE